MHKLSTLMRPIQAAAFLLAAAAAIPSHAADLLVRVSGLAEPLGQVGCTLFAGPAGFPMDSSSARVIWLPADAKGVNCRFNDLPEGRYAVSIGHDVNGNKKVDTNLFGIPTEAWGGLQQHPAEPAGATLRRSGVQHPGGRQGAQPRHPGGEMSLAHPDFTRRDGP